MKNGSRILFLVIACTIAARAQQPAPRSGPPASELPPILREVGFDQNLDKQMPLDITFADETGAPVQIAQ
jgi:hypothetical protein